MVPISDDPFLSSETPDPGAGRGDPVRVAVQFALGLYLLPVVAVVCLIGGVSVLAHGAAKIAGRSVFGAARRTDHRQVPTARVGRPETIRRFASEHARSRAAH